MVTILSHPLVVETILPFLLVFTLIFAILQKSKILGEGKKQIDAIVALVIGLIIISFGYATGIILSLIPLLAVGSVVILVFMLLYGLSFEPGSFKLHGGVKAAIGVLAAISVIVATLIATGAWSYLVEQFNTTGNSSSILMNLVFIVLIAVAFAVFAFGGKKESGDKKKE